MKKNKTEAKANMNRSCHSRQNNNVGSKSSNKVTSRSNNNVSDSQKPMGFDDEE